MSIAFSITKPNTILNVESVGYYLPEGIFSYGIMLDNTDGTITLNNQQYEILTLSATQMSVFNEWFLSIRGEANALLVNQDGSVQRITLDQLIKRNYNAYTEFMVGRKQGIKATYSTYLNKALNDNQLQFIRSVNKQDYVVPFLYETVTRENVVISTKVENQKPLIVGQKVASTIVTQQQEPNNNYSFSVVTKPYNFTTISSPTPQRLVSPTVQKVLFATLNLRMNLVNDTFYFDSNAGVDFSVALKPRDFSYYACDSHVGFALTITDDTTFTYRVDEKPNATFKIYEGKSVGNDFINAFQLIQISHNQFLTSKEIVYQSTLDKENLTETILSKGATSLEYSYKGNKFNVTKNFHYVTDKIDNIAFCKTDYKLGEKFEHRYYPISKVGSLTYDDGTTIAIQDVMSLDSTATFEITPQEFTITKDTSNPFTITYSLKSTRFSNHSFAFNGNVVQGETLFDRVELIDSKNDYLFNEIYQFGTNAKLNLYSSDNQIVQTLAFNEFNNKLDLKDTRYGQVVSATDGQITLTNIYKGKQFTQVVNTSYASELIINSNNVKKSYFTNELNGKDFDYTGLTGYVIYHNNKVQPTEITNINVTTFNYSHEPIDLSRTNIYVVSVSTTYENRTLSKNFEIQVKLFEPISIEVSGTDTNIYYDNDASKFALPKNITIKRKWSDNKQVDTLTNNDLEYFRDSAYQIKLNVGDVLKASDGTKIYVRDKNYPSLKGSYYIAFKPDKVIKLEMINSLSIPLGNYLNDFRSKVTIKATYVSGQTNSNYTNWKFKNQNRIDSKPSSVVIISGTEEHTITGITFTNPEIKSLTIDTRSFHTSYNNTNDRIDVRSITIKVTYVDSKYEEVASKYVYSTLNASDEFTVSCTDLPSFKYDGTSVINYDMKGQVTHTTNLEFKVKNHFSATTKTINVPIQIVEITNITGLKLVNAKTSYKVGETFLNESDNTEIVIFYTSPTGQAQKIQVKLNGGFSALNIYPLKGTTFFNKDHNVTVRVSCATNSNIYFEYNIEVIADVSYNDTTEHNLSVIKANSYTLPNGVKKNNVYLIVDRSNTIVGSDGIRVLLDGKTLENVKVYGFLDDVGNVNKNGIVVLFEDYVPIIQGESNIIVEYPCYNAKNADLINHCHFGQLFGNNNAKNRLFLSGNPNHPNADWHSGAVNTYKQEGDVVEKNGDFTYFEDTSVMNYGQTDNKIVGYDIISDSKMIVLKSASDKEPTVYYRSNGLIRALDGGGNSATDFNGGSLYEESYPLIIGNSRGSGAISNKAIINFNGDTLFLSSDNELDGLDITGQIGDSQRFANTRSYYIDPLLKKVDLNNSFLWTNNKYLYIVNDNDMFVTNFKTINAETRQYEWWKFDIKHISSMLDFNGTTYYGTNNGIIGKFENGIFEDIERVFLTKGSIKLETNEIDGDKVIVSKRAIDLVDMNETNYFIVDSNESDGTSYLYSQVANIENVKAGNVDVFINEVENKLEIIGYSNNQPNYQKVRELKLLLNENSTYFLNNGENLSYINASESNPLKTYYKKYKLKLAPSSAFENTCYYLVDYETQEILDIRKLYKASLVKRVDEKLEMIEIDKANCTFKLIKNGKKVDLVRYGNQEINQTFSARIDIYKKIKAYYVTAPITMGDLMYDKTLWGYTLTNDTNIPSEIELCQATNEEDFLSITSLAKTDYSVSYNDFALGNLSFDKVVIPHKYTFYRPLLAPFICFAFRNFENSNCVLSALQVSYTIAKNSFGGY